MERHQLVEIVQPDDGGAGIVVGVKVAADVAVEAGMAVEWLASVSVAAAACVEGELVSVLPPGFGGVPTGLAGWAPQAVSR
jgi:hypothetical protein